LRKQKKISEEKAKKILPDGKPKKQNTMLLLKARLKTKKNQEKERSKS
jgi:hypothetical protein